jgi:CBS-domain-containing membrane protein
MMERLVKDVMTVEVVTVSPATPYKRIAELLVEHDLSVLPVVDRAGRVLGIVSEADLLLKTQDASKTRPLGPHDHVEAAKASSLVAAGLMTTEVVTVGPDTPVSHAARLLRVSGVKRLPVVTRDGVLAGIVGRSDLLRSFVRPDHEILRAVVEDVIKRGLVTDPRRVEVTVRGGIVTLDGRVERRSQVQLADRLVRAVQGVVAFNNQLAFEVDDANIKPPASNRQSI